MNVVPAPTYTCFSGHRCIASGALPEVALALKRAAEQGTPDTLLTFEDATGRLFEIDTRGSDADVLARLPLPVTDAAAPVDTLAEVGETRGRGRPKLGVVAREVTLLPRHWDWLAAQPGGASVALRKLVEEARRASVDKDRIRSAQNRAYRFMSAVAGDFPNFEEASRALFANDSTRFSQLIALWPPDVRDYAMRLANNAS